MLSLCAAIEAGIFTLNTPPPLITQEEAFIKSVCFMFFGFESNASGTAFERLETVFQAVFFVIYEIFRFL